MTYPDLFTSPLVGYAPEAALAAVDVIRTYCGWHIAPSVDDTVTLDGSGTAVLLLPSLHVTAVASVVEDGTALDATTYKFSAPGILTRKGYRCWDQDVVVTFTHGYDDGPPALRAVASSLAKAGITARAGSVQVGQVRVTSSPDQAAGVVGLSDAASAVLNRYRLLP